MSDLAPLAIIGSGPAAWTAAIYAARGRLAPQVFTGQQLGGQLTTTTEVENFPGFPEGIQGPELVARMQQQAERFGTDVRMGATVESISTTDGGWNLAIDDMMTGTKSAVSFRAVIVATGASARTLGIPSEAAFFGGKGHGVTACATCDGALPAYRNQEVAVIGGGDSACEEAMFMTRFASKVYLVHRRDALRASKIMAQRVLEHPKIQPIWWSTISNYIADDQHRLTAVELEDTRNGAKRILPLRGVFLAIGHQPNTVFLASSGLKLDSQGYIEVEGGCRTNLTGIFAAGDVRDKTYRQAISAAGMGCMAAIEAERFLNGH